MSVSNKSNTIRSKASHALKTESNTQNASFYLADQSTISKQSPCYIPLCLGSQSGHIHVLYYNANALLDEIFNCANARMQAVIDLMESLFEYNTAEKTAISAVANASAYLLNDAMTLLQELNQIAIQLKANTRSN